MWQELIDVLAALLELYTRQLELTKEKRLLIVAVKFKELEALTAKEQALVDAVSRREKQRVAVWAELINRYNIPTEASKLLDLLHYCDDKTGQRIARLHKDLTETLRALTKEGKLNNNLLRQALGVVNYKLNVLSGAKVESTYSAAGGERVSTRSNFNFNA